MGLEAIKDFQMTSIVVFKLPYNEHTIFFLKTEKTEIREGISYT